MIYHINGQSVEVAGDSHTLSQLLELLTLAGKRVMIEVNHTIIPIEQYAAYVLPAEANIEMVQFVGGG